MFYKKFSDKSNTGLTLIEMVVTAGILAILMGNLIVYLSKNRVDLNKEANLIVANIRNAQNSAVSARAYNNTLRCGYGIQYVDSTTYRLYAGPDSSTVDCSDEDRRCGPGSACGTSDPIVETYTIKNPKVEFATGFVDFLYEPPDPKVYICDPGSPCFAGGGCKLNCAKPNLSPDVITIRVKGATCPGTQCKTINVYTSGRIEVQ